MPSVPPSLERLSVHVAFFVRERTFYISRDAPGIALEKLLCDLIA